MSTQSYTIYLLKDTIGSFDAALDPEKQTTPYNLNAGLSFTGTLYVGDQHEATPGWVALLNPFLQTPVGHARSASISAILLVNYENRIFAVTFGYGKGLLAGSSWVRDFGLKVTLNRVNPAKLRSIDTKTYDDLVVSMRKQTSKSSDVGSFELDVARNLVRGVTGDSEDETFFKRLTGSDAITLTTELAFADFGDLLDELLAAYADTQYKTHFEWVDNVKEADPLVRDQLDGLLVNALQAGNTAGMHLAPADIVDWEKITGFNYTNGKKSITYSELDFENYVEVLNDKLPTLTINQLKAHRVKVREDGVDTLQDKWSVYDCLVWEADLGGKKHVLFDSRWFEVEQAYATRVQTFVASVSSAMLTLPNATAGQDEGEYNEAVANGDPIKFALLDCETIKADGASTRIEFCDLMSDARQIIHVKKRSSSATLSHLFSQGSVSADVFLRDATARTEIRTKLTALGKMAHVALIPTARPASDNYEVVYAVIAKNGAAWPPPLPFFSAVNLMHHASRIQNLGFKVSLQHVKQV